MAASRPRRLVFLVIGLCLVAGVWVLLRPFVRAAFIVAADIAVAVALLIAVYLVSRRILSCRKATVVPEDVPKDALDQEPPPVALPPEEPQRPSAADEVERELQELKRKYGKT